MTSRVGTAWPSLFNRLWVVAAHCAVFAFVSVTFVDAANECQVSYVYTSGSGPSAVPMMGQTQVSANATKTINQDAMRYVKNDRDWPVDVEVTTLPSGTKWVHLPKKGDRDPANGSFVGNIELRKVKCLPGGTAGSGAAAAPAPVQTVETVVGTFFTIVSSQKVEEAEKKKAALRELKEEADRIKRLQAASYPGCPSAEAQAKYDELNEGRRSAVSARTAVDAQLAEAKQGLTACQQQLANNPSCVTAHAQATSPLVQLQVTATSAILALDEALAVLRSLKCVRPADQRLVDLVANP